MKYKERIIVAATKLKRLNDVADLLAVLELAEESGEEFFSPDSLIYWGVENGLIENRDFGKYLDWMMVEIQFRTRETLIEQTPANKILLKGILHPR